MSTKQDEWRIESAAYSQSFPSATSQTEDTPDQPLGLIVGGKLNLTATPYTGLLDEEWIVCKRRTVRAPTHPIEP